MTDRPILLNTAMVRAVLAGQKTQTRRPIKRENKPDPGFKWAECLCREIDPSDTPCPMCDARFPEIPAVGDRLWVRETFAIVHPCRDAETGYIDDIRQPTDIPKDNGGGFWVPWYRADWNGNDDADRGFKWMPSIHMPRWASRITLPLVSVRVERVQDISETDSMAEGVIQDPETGYWGVAGRPHRLSADDSDRLTARDAFTDFWKELYGQESWDANPWVWVAEWSKAEVVR